MRCGRRRKMSSITYSRTRVTASRARKTIWRSMLRQSGSWQSTSEAGANRRMMKTEATRQRQAVKQLIAHSDVSLELHPTFLALSEHRQNRTSVAWRMHKDGSVLLTKNLQRMFVADPWHREDRWNRG